MILGACFGLGPFALDTADRDHDQRIILELNVSRGGGQGSRRNVPGTFLRTKSITESFLARLVKDLQLQDHKFS